MIDDEFVTILNDEFVANLPDDALDAVKAIFNEYEKFSSATQPPLSSQDTQSKSDKCIQFLGLMKVIAEKFGLEELSQVPAATGDTYENNNNTRDYFDTVEKWVREQIDKANFLGSVDKYRALLTETFSYEFSDDETTRINELILELRQIISESKLFEEGHRQRLLKRLERLQSETHKKVSDLDRFWGLVGDAGVALRKFGEDAKPIVERVRELTEIIWSAQAKAEGLPKPDTVPLLTKSDE